ncbi:MAG TPA: hypothetical protein VNA13_00765, partial [Xanthomonadales bacterium]|nr:hypothetical protein [Xanthomonadales bacterium]
MTENEYMSDGTTTPPGEGEVPVGPLPLDPAERPAAPEPDSGVVGDVEPTPISENPVSESSKFLDSLLEEA